jgi:hypothetical protein
MITIQINPEFAGPDILSLRDLLPLNDSPITVSWSNAWPEQYLLRKFPSRDITLVVPDLSAMERTAVTLGLPYEIDDRTHQECIKALVAPKGGKWRGFASGVGNNVARAIALQLAAADIRQGNIPTVRKFLTHSLINNTSMAEIDLLLGLCPEGM